MHDAFVGLLSYGRVKDSECINLLMGFHDSFAKKCNGFPCNSTFSCLLLCLSPFALPCSMFGREDSIAPETANKEKKKILFIILSSTACKTHLMFRNAM